MTDESVCLCVGVSLSVIMLLLTYIAMLVFHYTKGIIIEHAIRQLSMQLHTLYMHTQLMLNNSMGISKS